MGHDIGVDEADVRSAHLCVERANWAFEETRRAIERSQQVLQQSLKALGQSAPDESPQVGSGSGGKLEQQSGAARVV
jgi:hypothetical protein